METLFFHIRDLCHVGALNSMQFLFSLQDAVKAGLLKGLGLKPDLTPWHKVTKDTVALQISVDDWFRMQVAEEEEKGD